MKSVIMVYTDTRQKALEGDYLSVGECQKTDRIKSPEGLTHLIPTYQDD